MRREEKNPKQSVEQLNRILKRRKSPKIKPTQAPNTKTHSSTLFLIESLFLSTIKKSMLDQI